MEPKRVLKTQVEAVWQRHMLQVWNDRWSPNFALLGLREAKKTDYWSEAKNFARQLSFGLAIESGQHDLETIGPEWWDKSSYWWVDFGETYHIDSPRHLDSRYGQEWWIILKEGIWPFARQLSIMGWQEAELQRQEAMCQYSIDKIFEERWPGTCTVADVQKNLELHLDRFAFSFLADSPAAWKFAEPWDYRHYAQCIVANLEGRPYLYRRPQQLVQRKK